MNFQTKYIILMFYCCQIFKYKDCNNVCNSCKSPYLHNLFYDKLSSEMSTQYLIITITQFLSISSTQFLCGFLSERDFRHF